MARNWFTSDNHFGHKNIIHHCSRPFVSTAEMDAVMVANWNALVQPDDNVWHIGDFCYKSSRAPADHLQRLNGHKHLIWGNHDSDQSRSAPGWASSQAYAEITVDDQRMVLFHYALRTWRWIGRGAIHVFGHSHGRLLGDRQSCDVGVDAWDFRPVSLSEIRGRLLTLPERIPLDHHEA